MGDKQIESVYCPDCGGIGGGISEDDRPEWYKCDLCEGKGRIARTEAYEDCPICDHTFSFLDFAGSVGMPPGSVIGRPDPCPFHGEPWR